MDDCSPQRHREHRGRTEKTEIRYYTFEVIYIPGALAFARTLPLNASGLRFDLRSLCSAVSPVFRFSLFSALCAGCAAAAGAAGAVAKSRRCSSGVIRNM